MLYSFWANIHLTQMTKLETGALPMDILAASTVPAHILKEALTHSSYANEHPGTTDNERLEFLGDAVLELAISTYLFQTYPHKSEGELSLMRSSVVNTVALANMARQLNLGDHLRLGRGSDISGSRDLDSVLAATFEAVIGAVYIGCGWQMAYNYICQHLAGQERDYSGKDNKSLLQEHIQSQSAESPTYCVVHTDGPDHARQFVVEVRHAGQVLGQGRGRSKKAAEQEAARAALRKL